MNNNSIKFSSAYLEALAERQFKDYKKKNPGSYFAENINNLTIEDAYVVQKEFSSLRCLNGDNIVGYKVGCIGPVVIEQFGMAGPVYGRIFEKEIYSEIILIKTGKTQEAIDSLEKKLLISPSNILINYH